MLRFHCLLARFCAPSEIEFLGHVASGSLSGRMQPCEESYQGRSFRRAQILPVGRHVTATLDHLANELILGKTKSNTVEGRPALATNAVQRMAVAALFCLKNNSAPAFESRASLQILRW